METETETTVGLRPAAHPVGTTRLAAWVEDQDGRRVVAILSMAELRGLVQAAYDVHGIVAAPSIERETERADHLREFADTWGTALAGQAATA